MGTRTPFDIAPQVSSETLLSAIRNQSRPPQPPPWQVQRYPWLNHLKLLSFTFPRYSQPQRLKIERRGTSLSQANDLLNASRRVQHTKSAALRVPNRDRASAA